jgi:catechol 2,3-dioxygenase-like lactoylglutathione lyase family enzyme
MDDYAGAYDQHGVEQFLLSRRADRLAHPGGNLYDHLRRVAATLRSWSADEATQAAGLCHACYGTDGFDAALVPVTDRATLARLIGSRAESLVYLYGSCDRSFVYSRIGEGTPVPFHDRFTGLVHSPAEIDVRAFMEITAANELDVVAHNATLAVKHGADLLRLFTRAQHLLSGPAWQACVQALGNWADNGQVPASAVDITGVDHIVLTVANVDRTVDFYQRVLGMRPVTFGEGRRALAFGTTKINLHQVGQELAPHAAHAVPGSADLCFVATTPLDQVIAHLHACEVAVEVGPVTRTGAVGPIRSVYFRDPDANLLEISNYAS